MSEDLAALLAALAELSPAQFFMLSLGLAASVLSAFPVRARTHMLGISFRAIATILWSVSWVAMPNALADWMRDRNRRYSDVRKVA